VQVPIFQKSWKPVIAVAKENFHQTLAPKSGFIRKLRDRARDKVPSLFSDFSTPDESYELSSHSGGSKPAYLDNITLHDRPHLGHRLTPFPFHPPLYQNHRHTLPTASHCHLQRPHLVGRNTLGLTPLRGPGYTTNFNGIPTSLLATRWLMRYTPARTALSPPQSSSGFSLSSCRYISSASSYFP
jgi:hypothetical protein